MAVSDDSLKRILVEDINRTALLDCGDVYTDYLSKEVAVSQLPIKEYRVSKRVRRLSFRDCPLLETAVIPEGAEYVDFSYCVSLKRIVLPKSCVYFNFDGCTSLESLKAPRGLPEDSIGNVLNCRELSDLDETVVKHIRVLGGCPKFPKGLYKHLNITASDNFALSHINDLENLSVSCSDGSDSPSDSEDERFNYGMTRSDLVVGVGAFNSCTNLNTLTLNPDNLSISDKSYGIGDRSFMSCKDLPILYIPAKIDNIYAEAFKGCVSLESLTTEDDTTTLSVAGGAFFGCLALDTSNIVSRCTNIGDSAFKLCTSLTSADIKITSIPASSFERCTALTTVSVGSATVGDRAFYQCTSLVNFSGTVSASGSEAFRYCGNLVEASADATAELMFSDCSKLERVNVAGSFGAACFNRCYSLQEIITDTEERDVYPYTFSGCYSLSTIGSNSLHFITSTDKSTIPATVVYPNGLQKNVSLTKALKYSIALDIDDVTSLFACCVSIPSAYYCRYHRRTETSSGTTYRVGIPANNYRDCWSVTSLDFNLTHESNDFVGLIGERALKNCISLTGDVDIPTNVGAEAFVGCISLNKVSLYYDNTAAETSAATVAASKSFKDCVNLTGATLGDSAADTFEGCYSLSALDGGMANEDCVCLSSIRGSAAPTFEAPVLEYSDCTGDFSNILSLKSSTGKGSSYIGCACLSEIQGTTATVSENLFKDSVSLTSYTADSVAAVDGTIGDRAFFGCTNLEKFEITGGYIKELKGFDEDSLRPVYSYTPTAAKSIGDEAFKDCRSLLQVKLPVTLRQISPTAFTGCTALSEIIIERVSNADRSEMSEYTSTVPNKLSGAPWGYPYSGEPTELADGSMLYGDCVVKYVYVDSIIGE